MGTDYSISSIGVCCLSFRPREFQSMVSRVIMGVDLPQAGADPSAACALRRNYRAAVEKTALDFTSADRSHKLSGMGKPLYLALRPRHVDRDAGAGWRSIAKQKIG